MDVNRQRRRRRRITTATIRLPKRMYLPIVHSSTPPDASFFFFFSTLLLYIIRIRHLLSSVCAFWIQIRNFFWLFFFFFSPVKKKRNQNFLTRIGMNKRSRVGYPGIIVEKAVAFVCALDRSCERSSEWTLLARLPSFFPSQKFFCLNSLL